MTEKKKAVDPPVDPGPVVSQAGPAAAAAAPSVPTPDAPIVLSQVPSNGWSKGNLPRRS